MPIMHAVSYTHLDVYKRQVYRIELYNPDLDQSDKDYYNIRRNTIYRVFATLKGPGNMEYDIVVDEWEDTEVAIPW